MCEIAGPTLTRNTGAVRSRRPIWQHVSMYHVDETSEEEKIQVLRIYLKTSWHKNELRAQLRMCGERLCVVSVLFPMVQCDTGYEHKKNAEVLALRERAGRTRRKTALQL